jgi:hypothetical protein
MASHCFNTELAKRYSIEEAILVEHLYWWIRRNECNSEMEKEGRVWCYMTANGMSEYFSYMNSQKVRRISIKLNERGKVLIGNFNKVATNQTLWYAFSDDFIQELSKLGYDFSKMKNGNFKNEKSIEDIRKEYNIHNHIDALSKSKDLSKSQYDSDPLFEDFWRRYKRKGVKSKALKMWNRLNENNKKLALIAVDDYVLFCKRSNRSQADGSTFLNQEYYLEDWKKIPACYQDSESDVDKRTINFKRYMREKWPDLIYHRNPLTVEQGIEMIEKYGINQFEWILSKLCERDIHQYYSIKQGIEKVFEETEAGI